MDKGKNEWVGNDSWTGYHNGLFNPLNWSRWKKTRWIVAGLAAAPLPLSAAIDPSDYLSYSTGRLLIKPRIGLSEVYHSNIYYQETDEEADLITQLSPGLNLTLGQTEFNHIALDYQFDQLWYIGSPEVNSHIHNLRLSNQLEGNKISTSGTAGYQFLSTPLTGNLTLVGSARLLDRHVYNFRQEIDYSLGEKTGTYVGFDYRGIDYQEGAPVLDSDNREGTIGFRFDYSSKTTFFGEIFYGQTDNEWNTPTPNPPSQEYVGGFLGARGDFTEKLTGSVRVGYEERSFDSGGDSLGQPAFDISLTHQFSPKTSTTLSFTRRTAPSDQDGISSFTGNRVNLQIMQALGNSGKLFATAGSSYELRDFTEFFGIEREDETWSFNASMIYQFKLWMKGVLSYDFDKIDSTSPFVIKYDVHRVTLGLSLGY